MADIPAGRREGERVLTVEAGVYVANGPVGPRGTVPVLTRSLSADSARGLTVSGVLGTHRAAAGLFAVAGTSANQNSFRASAGVGVWAETSPRGRALGPAVEARLRASSVHAEAGIVPVGRPARWVRAGIDLPLELAVAVVYFGVSAEVRRFADTGETLRSVSLSLTL